MRFYNQPHEYYCGIDLHVKTMYVCILDAGGHVTGIIPEFLGTKERMLTGVNELIVTKSMHERKMTMFEHSEQPSPSIRSIPVACRSRSATEGARSAARAPEPQVCSMLPRTASCALSGIPAG